MKNVKNPTFGIAVVLAILAASTAILQVSTTDEATTKLESALFSVLQFMFSIGFSWLLARISLKAEFKQSQKQFAISAYRRINEINFGVQRILSRVKLSFAEASIETRHELDVIRAISTGVSDSIQSSIADWADVIGEELVTLEKIEELREAATTSETLPESLETTALTSKLAELNKLIESLPHQLQVVARTERSDSDVETLVRKLDTKRKRIGKVFLEGFWDPSFGRKITEFSAGDTLTAQIGTVGTRRSALIVKDDNDVPIGVLTNTFSQKYEKFTESVLKHMGKSYFTVTISFIAPSQRGQRHYFTVSISSDRVAI